LTAQRSDHQLTCSLTDLASGETLNASVLLDVQYKPEILQADARYQESEGTGLLLVLSVLVQANPPASITWVDQDGRVMANTSEFLFLDATHYPGLANHSLRVHLSSAAGNISVSAANSMGVTTTSLLPAGLLDARVELPLLGVAVGAALALSTVFGLGSCVAGLLCHQTKPVPGQEPAGRSCSHSSSSEQPQSRHLPRQTQSLPPDLRLSDLAGEPQCAGGGTQGPQGWMSQLSPLSFPPASPRDAGSSAREEDSALRGLENSLALSKLGFVQLPLSGRIYKVPSTSSEEIWL
ncbi:TMM25 protein, partial [Crotophaga sulcirostris]|nr:TMM25 protein [Crotophaga sulcirostris]